MPTAAVPAYLGNDFREASPGLRFGFFLPIWTTRQDQEADVRKRAEARSREGQEVADMLQRQGMDATINALRNRERNRLPSLWDKNDFAAREVWKTMRALSPADKHRMKALADRQSALATAVPADAVFHLDALATAPFTTGLGNEHPLENGFAFLNPYGLPYLPGSGIKGVLRQAARELASGDWGETHGWDEGKHAKVISGKEIWSYPIIDALFGEEDSNNVLRGALSFWDVIPQIKGDSLMVEIMTPHQSHYYQKGESPHESGQPTPISFLTVPPGSEFAFHVQCDLAHLNRLAPDLAQEGRWKTLLEAAFTHAFDWFGFGAKTAVGYGAMARKNPPQTQSSSDETWENALLSYSVSTRDMTATHGDKKVVKREAKSFFDALGSKGRQDKVKSGRLEASVKVRITPGQPPELLEILPLQG